MIEKYLCIEPSGKIRWIDLERVVRYDGPYDGEEDILVTDLYPVIGCDCVEQVRSVLPGVYFFVDESGKCKFPMQRYNALASRFYAGASYCDYIHGPAVFFTLKPSGPLMEHYVFPLSPAQENMVSMVLGCELPDKE